MMRIKAILAALAALVLPAASSAQTPPGNYPDKPVKIIVPFAPAGPTDVVARLIATKLSERSGRQFYIENVTGAGGNTGMGQAARGAGRLHGPVRVVELCGQSEPLSENSL
jgi:tripartite-type tricarboxylate transporter receptor subunit TctC